MYICFVDESGGFEAPNSPVHGVTPVMVIAGIVVHADKIPDLTRDFLAIKRKHFPGRFSQGPALNHILTEINGSELLALTRDNKQGKRRHAALIREDILSLMENQDVKTIARVWVKAANQGLRPTASYTYAIQDIARHFANFISGLGSRGMMVCDSREQQLNVKTAHSVFTDKFRTGVAPLNHLIDTAVFAHSDNHAGIQLADLVASAFLFPMSAATYCSTTAKGGHASSRYADICQDSGARLRSRQYIYRDDTGRSRGGVVVSDNIAQKSSAEMFKFMPPRQTRSTS